MSKMDFKSLKPTQAAIKSAYEDFHELKELLENSEYVKDGYFIVNNHKWFTKGFPNFLKFKINHNSKSGVHIKRIEVKLSRSSVDGRSEKENEVIDSRWKNHPKDILGKGIPTKYFQEGHLLARSLVKYAQDFKRKKRENFVMITEWCNCAEASSYSGKGMKYFERIVLDSLEAGRDIYYRVSPVFKKLSDSNGYELLPRGIILTANITNGKDKKFVGYEGTQFNVFIPNAQEDLIISYKAGCIYKRTMIICKRKHRKKKSRKRVFQIKKVR